MSQQKWYFNFPLISTELIHMRFVEKRGMSLYLPVNYIVSPNFRIVVGQKRAAEWSKVNMSL